MMVHDDTPESRARRWIAWAKYVLRTTGASPHIWEFPSGGVCLGSENSSTSPSMAWAAAFPKEYHVYCLRKGLACEHPALTPAELAAFHLLDDPVDFWKTLDQVACSPDPKTPAMEATGDFSL